MMQIRSRMRTQDARGDDGIAIVAVMVAIAVITALLVVALGFSIRNQKSGRTDQDAKTATAAAQAGIEEYLSRLNANSNYYTNNNVDATNPAYTAGQPVQGTGSSGATYTYKVLSSTTETAKTGIVRLQVTGKSGVDSGRTVKRTLTANLRTKGFLNFIYLSDVEVTDPALTGADPTNCGKYWYNGRLSGCGEIQWTGGDTVNGPLHSNDALQINGPVTYKQSVETGCPATVTAGVTATCPAPKTWWGTQTGGTLPANAPKYATSLALPDANSSMASNTTPGLNGTDTGPGCFYTGATKITFTGSTMSVLSPATTSNKTPSRCYNYQTPNTLQTGLAIPPVIYVDDTTNACTYRAIGYPATSEAVTVGSNTATYWTSPGSNKTTNYGCGRGTAYVNGTADAQVSVATANDIVVTGNLTVADNLTTTDVIGLIANNDVWVYHPLNAGSNELLAAGSRVTQIQAAILSVTHSFLVQNWADGDPLGTLNVSGAIAQKFRGPVGTGNGSTLATGYYKNYVYDPRLAYQQPPYFLSPVSSEWHLSSITDD